MKIRHLIASAASLAFATFGIAQVTLLDFSNTVQSGFTFFYGSFSNTGAPLPPTGVAAAGMTQNSGFYSFTGSTTNNSDTSALEIYLPSPVNLSGLGFLALTAETLSTNAAPSIRVFLFDSGGGSASAAFTATSFPTGNFTTAIQALNIAGPFNPASVESIIITGDTFGGTARFNFSFDHLAAVSAIPEPSTYAAIIGLLALGYVAYRRRQLAA